MRAAEGLTPGAGSKPAVASADIKPNVIYAKWFHTIFFNLLCANYSSQAVNYPHHHYQPIHWGASGIILEATSKLMKSFNINKHDRGRMFYLQSLLKPQRKEKETKVQGWVSDRGWGGLKKPSN